MEKALKHHCLSRDRDNAPSNCDIFEQFHLAHIMFWKRSPADPGGPWAQAPPPHYPQDFFQIMQFQEILRENPFFVNFGLSAPLGSKVHWPPDNPGSTTGGIQEWL